VISWGIKTIYCPELADPRIDWPLRSMRSCYMPSVSVRIRERGLKNNTYFMLPVSSETGNSVSIATGYGLDGPGIESWWGRHFPHRSRPAPGTQPATCTMGTGSFPEVKRGRGVKLTPHPLLVTWSWKGRAIPLLPLWAVRPVQSLSACTGVHFTFTFRGWLINLWLNNNGKNDSYN
jgi:hypothetical protein